MMKGYTVFSPILHSDAISKFIEATDEFIDLEWDWVKEDLALVKEWLNDHCSCECKQKYDHAEFQPNITFLFAPTCFGPSDDSERDPDTYYAYEDEDGAFWWVSKGAKQEYDYAKIHHIPCYLLDPFLKGILEAI